MSFNSKENNIFQDFYKKIKLKLWKLEKNFLYYLPRKVAHQWYYKRRTGKELNVSNPKDFNEKLQWLIIYIYGEHEAKYADKLLVRDYVKSKGFDFILPKLYGVYNKASEINYDELPMKFVLKANHGSGEDFYAICEDKKNLNRREVSLKLDKALKKNYAKESLEYHYAYIERKIICEEFIESDLKGGLIDYKVFCFHGEPKYTLVTFNRRDQLKRAYYDINWNSVDLLREKYKGEFAIEKPSKYEEMLNIAKELSEPFLFARIDFYNVKEKLYFGEITLTPATGINMTYSKKGLDILGSKLNLSMIQINK